MSRFRELVREIHRRSLWQVLAVYLASSWFVLQVTEHVVQRFLLPEWVYGGAVVLLLVGLPIVLATALVREAPEGTLRSLDDRSGPGPLQVRRSPREEGGSEAAGGPLRSLLTWPRAILGGVTAFALLALLGGFFYLQGIPRIAEARGAAGEVFEGGGWIVVTDFEAAQDDDRTVALATREALTVDLQQSEHVSVLSRSQVAGVLRRMEVPETTPLLGPLALEVAERAGAGAVLTATVSRLGPQYVVTGRALRPGTGEELFAVRVASAEARLLEAVETLSREVRRRLGESRGTIRESRPLPEVTTRSLDALKAYAEAERALDRGDTERAAALAVQAGRLDPGFAMAHRLAAVAAFNSGRPGEGREHAVRAWEHRDRLTDRERWQVEGFYHLLVDLDVQRAVEAYELLLARYPDDFRAATNLGTALLVWMSDDQRAAVWTERALEIDRNSLLAVLNAAEMRGRTGPLDQVDPLIRELEEGGLIDVASRLRVVQDFARGRYDRIGVVCDSILASTPRMVRQTDDRELCGGLNVALGRLDRGQALLAEVRDAYLDRRMYMRAFHATHALSLGDQLATGDASAGVRRFEELLARIPPDAIPEPDRFTIRVHLQAAAHMAGAPDLARAVEERIPPYPEPDHWITRQGANLVLAAEAAAQGDGEGALAVLGSGAAGGGAPVQWWLWREMVQTAAHQRAGRVDEAIGHLRWYTHPGNAAYASPASFRATLPLALVHLAELEEARGDRAAAVEAYRRVIALWDGADPELAPRLERIRQALARLEAGDA